MGIGRTSVGAASGASGGHDREASAAVDPDAREGGHEAPGGVGAGHGRSSGAPMRRRSTSRTRSWARKALPRTTAGAGGDELQMAGGATGIAPRGSPGGEDQQHGRRRHRSGCAAHGLSMAPVSRSQTRRRRPSASCAGLRLEYATLAWNVVRQRGPCSPRRRSRGRWRWPLRRRHRSSRSSRRPSSSWQLKGTARDGRDRLAHARHRRGFALLALYIRRPGRPHPAGRRPSGHLHGRHRPGWRSPSPPCSRMAAAKRATGERLWQPGARY
jgi:hypothetical protein